MDKFGLSQFYTNNTSAIQKNCSLQKWSKRLIIIQTLDSLGRKSLHLITFNTFSILSYQTLLSSPFQLEHMLTFPLIFFGVIRLLWIVATLLERKRSQNHPMLRFWQQCAKVVIFFLPSVPLIQCFPKTGPQNFYGPPKLLNWSMKFFKV